jgi:hypothetical protein
MGKDLREWESKDRYGRLFFLKLILEVSLIKYVPFGILDEEDNATFMD